MDEAEYKLQILAPAQSELREIARVHLALVGSDSSEKITNRIHETLGRLITFPEMGVKCADKLLRLQGYRMLVCGNYLCFYRLVGDTVIVAHIVDGRSDYPKHMTDLEP